MRGAPSSRAAAGAGSKGSASSRLRARDGGGEGRRDLFGVGLERVGAGCFLHPAAGSRSGRGGETAGGSPWRGWRRRCRCRGSRRAVAAAAVAFAGATAASSGRGAAERAGESGGEERGAATAGSLTPTSSLGPASPSQPRSQSPRAAGPEPPAHWPAAVAVRAGAPRERTTAGIRVPPRSPGPPLSPPLGPGSVPPEAGANETAPQTEPTFPLAAGVSGTPLEEAPGNRSIWRGVLGWRLLCPRPFNWTVAGGAGPSSGRAWGKRGGRRPGMWGVTWIPDRNLGIPPTNRPPWSRA